MAARKQSQKRKKKRSIRMTDPEQSARFLKMAKEVEADTSGEAFARAMDIVAPKKPKE